MNWNEKKVVAHFIKKNSNLADITDARFVSPKSKNPVEYETAGLLYSLVRSTKAHTIVETGTNIGLSSLAMAQALEDDGLPNSHLFTYDITGYGVENQAKKLGLSHRVTFLKQSSLESDLAGQIAKIDLLFLDSLTELLEGEFNLFWKLLRKNSRVVIHDTRLYAGKQRAIENIKAKYGWVEMSFPAGRGVSILAPGANGKLATPTQIRYGVILDARQSNGDIPLKGWMTPEVPDEIWTIGVSKIDALSLPTQKKHTADNLEDAFHQATQSRVDYILYANCKIDNITERISALLEHAQKNESGWDYLAPSDLPSVEPHLGPLELQQISQRWITDRTYIRAPQISSLLFLVNARLLKEAGGFIKIYGDEQWSFSLMVARIMLVNGICSPMLDTPSSGRKVFAEHPSRQAGSDALRSAIEFHQHMPQITRKTYLGMWNRLVRVYYYDIGGEGRLWSQLVSKPLKLKDWWRIIYSQFLH